MRNGARILLASPHGQLARGEAEPVRMKPYLWIPNGAAGRIRGIADGGAYLVEFDDLGPGVVVNVPAHWVAGAPRQTDAR
jgi:hypothetical protein